MVYLVVLIIVALIVGIIIATTIAVAVTTLIADVTLTDLAVIAGIAVKAGIVGIAAVVIRTDVAVTVVVATVAKTSSDFFLYTFFNSKKNDIYQLKSSPQYKHSNNHFQRLFECLFLPLNLILLGFFDLHRQQQSIFYFTHIIL